MSNKDILNRPETEGMRETGEEKENKITLESILREYDAKKAAQQKQPEEEVSPAREWEAFERELQEQQTAAPEDADDSDMKVVSGGIGAADIQNGSAERNSSTEQRDSADMEETEEFSKETLEHKRDIMSEISKRFEAGEEKPAEPPEALPDSETQTVTVGGEEAGDSRLEEKDTEDVSDDETEEEESSPHSSRHGRKKIDDAALRRAFKEDGYDLYSGKGKKKKRREEEAEGGEEAEATTSSDVQERRRLFDENGERISGKSRYFTPFVEYTAESDPQEIHDFLQRKLLGSCLALIAVFVIMLVGFYMELAPTVGLPHPKALEPGRMGMIYALADLQILFLAAIVKLNSLCKGFFALSRKHPSAEAVSFVMVVAATLHTVATVIWEPTTTSPHLLCSVACFSVFVLALSDFMKARSEFMAFRIVSSEGSKYGFKDITASGEQTADEIGKFVPEGSTVLDVRKAGFAEHFFERSCSPAVSDKNTGVLILISFLVSVVAGILYYIFNKEAFDAFCGAVSIFMTSVQICMLVSSVLPETVFADRAARRKCAFVGHDLCQEYDNVSVVSFKDTEVFSPKDIKVTNIRTYGDTRIDSMIVTMARIFSYIGGPLSSVFSNSISGITLEQDDLKIIDVAPDGLWLKVDGDNVYIGTVSYMAENNFEVVPEAADTSFRQSNGAILYLASASRVMAKFYIKYALNPGFESVLRSLYTQGICARIKTMDPCINNDFIRASLRRPECLFSVVKAQSPDEVEREEATLSSGLISASGEHSLIQAFLLVRRMKSVLRVNGLIKTTAFVVGIALSTLMLLGGSSIISPAAILLMQIFWLIPMVIVAKLAAK